MKKTFHGFLRKALASRPLRASRPCREFNVEDYMPPFSERDHAIARRAGYSDAREQWLFETKGKLATHSEMERLKRAKLEKLLGMESEGVPMEDLISIAERTSRLPAWVEAGPPQVRVPEDPEVLKVKVAGMVNWYIALVERLTSRGLDFSMSEGDVPLADRGCFRDAVREREKLALRLGVCDENIDIIHEQIVRGLTHRVDRVEVVIRSDDPLIRQMQEDEETMRGESGEGEDAGTGNTLTVVLDADASVPRKDNADGVQDRDSEEAEDDDTEGSEDPAEHDGADESTPESNGDDAGEWDDGWSDPWN